MRERKKVTSCSLMGMNMYVYGMKAEEDYLEKGERTINKGDERIVL